MPETGVTVADLLTVQCCRLAFGTAVLGAPSWGVQGELLYALLVAVGGFVAAILGAAVATGAHRGVR